jgi:hypothetical protein
MIYPEINYLVPSHVTKYVFMWIERKGKREVTPKPGDIPTLLFQVLPFYTTDFSQSPKITRGQFLVISPC